MPQRVVGQGSIDNNLLVADGMFKLDMAGKQRDTAVWIAATGTVFKIAFDGASDGGELTANLMMTSRQKLHFQQVIAVGTAYLTIAQRGSLRLLHLMMMGIRLILLLVAGKPMLNLNEWRMNHGTGASLLNSMNLRFPVSLSLHDGPIGFVDLSLGKHLVQTGKGFAGTGKDNESADRTVKAMHNAEENLPWLVVLLLDILLDCFRKRFITSLVALHDFTTPLGDDNHMVIFINYLHSVSFVFTAFIPSALVVSVTSPPC